MTRPRARWFRTALLGAAVLLHPTSSFGYARAVDQHSQKPTFWASGCAVVTIYPNGYTGMTSDEIAKSISAAAHAWSPDVVTCPTTGDGGISSGHPSFEIVTQMAAPGARASAVADGKNVVVFRTDRWDDGDAIALTSRNTDPSGRIVDADIEINATDAVVWANLDLDAPGGHMSGERTDLQTAITHEFGHFLGLAHTCYHDGFDPPPRPVDDQGRPTPFCGDPSIPEAAAVMWYLVDRESTTKRVLTADDERGVCAIYPPNAAVPLCTANLPDDGCGCRTAGRPRPAAAALFGMAALLMLRRRRR